MSYQPQTSPYQATAYTSRGNTHRPAPLNTSYPSSQPLVSSPTALYYSLSADGSTLIATARSIPRLSPETRAQLSQKLPTLNFDHVGTTSSVRYYTNSQRRVAPYTAQYSLEHGGVTYGPQVEQHQVTTSLVQPSFAHTTPLPYKRAPMMLTQNKLPPPTARSAPPVVKDDYIIPGYGGHVRNYQYRFGRSYGSHTADILKEFPNGKPAKQTNQQMNTSF